MPWGLTRFHHSGQSHFVTFCCYHRRQLFTTDASRRIFESALERVRRSFKLQVYGYVVMPEHVHLLLSEPQRDASSGRTAPLKPKDGLNGPPVLSEPQQDTLAECAEVVEARSIAAFDWRCGAFLAKEVLRFQHSKLPAVCGKAALYSSQSGVPSEPAFGLLGWKPVKAGLCERPEEWEWSSFRHYATVCEGRVEIESDWTARKCERAVGRLCPAVELPNSSQNPA